MKEEYLTALLVSNFSLNKNLEGITEEESLKPIGIKGNCINWIAGHILAVRDAFFSNFGTEKFLNENEIKRYERGSEPVNSNESYTSILKIKEGLDITYKRWVELLNTKDESFFNTPIPADILPVPIAEPTIGKLLSVLIYHEGYHTGQIGLARRALGSDFNVIV